MAREYELAPKRPPGLSTEEVGKMALRTLVTLPPPVRTNPAATYINFQDSSNTPA